MNFRKTAALVAAASVIFSLGACATTDGETTASPTSGTNRPTESSSQSTTAPEPDSIAEEPEPAPSQSRTTSEPEPEPEPEPSLTDTEGPGILALGESFTYSDGLQVTVGKPQPMTSSEWAAPGGVAGLVMDVTIVNGSPTPFDPSMGYATAQTGNTEAEEIFDSENGLEGSPSTSVLPGREVTYKMAFTGTDLDSFVLEFAPSFDHGPLIFTPNGE